MTAFPSYSTGTISIAAAATAVIGTGTIFNGTNARPGDLLLVAGNPVVVIEDTADFTHLVIDAWPYAAVVNQPYKILQYSPLRFAGGQAMADVTRIVGTMNTDGFFVFVPDDELVPDPSLGDDGQYARKPTTGEEWLKDSGVWNSLGISDPAFTRYDIAIDVPGRPATNGVVAKWVAPSRVTFKATLLESAANADVAATAQTVFSLQKNGTEFATIMFAVSATTATFICAVDTAFNSGDVLTLVAPTRDETLANIAFTIVGLR